MYIPSAFRQADSRELFDLIEHNSFGLLVSHVEGQLFATHLPLLLDRQIGASGRLRGHMARANPQWRELDGQEVLVVFSGPHAYISPSWYEARDVVPTWNYTAVHAYGRVQIEDDESVVAQIVADYVTRYESRMPTPWTFDPQGAFFRKLLQAIVGFTVDVTRIEGKWKLGQNQPPQRRANVVRHLGEIATENAAEIAQLMAATIDDDPRV